MEALPPWKELACTMLINAGLVASDDRMESLALDLQALDEEMSQAYEGYDPAPASVVAELNRRIGGLKNLESYSDCLLVKERK